MVKEKDNPQEKIVPRKTLEPSVYDRIGDIVVNNKFPNLDSSLKNPYLRLAARAHKFLSLTEPYYREFSPEEKQNFVFNVIEKALDLADESVSDKGFRRLNISPDKEKSGLNRKFDDFDLAQSQIPNAIKELQQEASLEAGLDKSR